MDILSDSPFRLRWDILMSTMNQRLEIAWLQGMQTNTVLSRPSATSSKMHYEPHWWLVFSLIQWIWSGTFFSLVNYFDYSVCIFLLRLSSSRETKHIISLAVLFAKKGSLYYYRKCRWDDVIFPLPSSFSLISSLVNYFEYNVRFFLPLASKVRKPNTSLQKCHEILNTLRSGVEEFDLGLLPWQQVSTPHVTFVAITAVSVAKFLVAHQHTNHLCKVRHSHFCCCHRRLMGLLWIGLG